MRVCMLTGSFLPRVGGMEYVVHYLSEALSAIGVSVIVLAHRSSGVVTGPMAYEVLHYGYRVPFSGRLGLDRWSCARRIVRENRRQPFDILHCHNASYPGSIAYAAKRRLGLPLVITPHGEDVQIQTDVGYGLRRDPRWDHIIRRNLGAADRVTTISASIEDDVRACGVERISRIPNGVVLERFSGPRTRFLHQMFDLPENTKIVVSVGRNHPKKGYEIGIRAFAKVARTPDLPPVRYVLIGRGVSDLRGLVEAEGAADEVLLLEHLPQANLALAYRSAHVFFSPALMEGLSVVSVEALASGLPVVATRVPGNQDIIAEDNGMLVPSGSEAAMASALTALLTDSELWERLASGSRESALPYDWAAVADRYAEVYRDLAVTGDRPS